MARETKKAICYFCKGYCPVLVHTENGQLISVEEDPAAAGVDDIFPRTKGCMRRLRAKEVMYHPDRLNYPLKRAGEKGEGNEWVTFYSLLALKHAGKLKV